MNTDSVRLDWIEVIATDLAVNIRVTPRGYAVYVGRIELEAEDLRGAIDKVMDAVPLPE